MSTPTTRAQILVQQGRHDEAADAFRDALRDDPEHLPALLGLGFCLYQSESEAAHREGLDVVRRAAALAPNEPQVAFLRGLLLADGNDFKGAHAAMDEAIALDPQNAAYFGGKGQVFLRQQAWAKAEEAARRGLEIDADDPTSTNVLSSALLMRGDTEAHAGQVAQRLRQNPDDPHAHFNMGMAALRAGKHREAEKHFKEALRISPSFDFARQGLLDAFRSRSPFYRAFLRFTFRMSQLSPGVRTGVMLGAFVLYRIARGLAETRAPALAAALAVLWVTFALFTFLARGLGNLIIIADRTARHALNTKERWEGILVGGGVLAGLALVFAGLGTGLPGLTVIGVFLVAPAVPASVAFGATRRAGRRLYGGTAAIVAGCALVAIADAATHLATSTPSAMASPFFTAGILLAIASTWAAMFGVKTE